jgi:hypothetical protein
MKSAWFRAGPWLSGSVLAGAGLWLTFMSVAAAERPNFVSKGPDKAITVDAKYDDWYGALQSFGEDPVAIQFLNDGEFLYVRLTASDLGARRLIARQGMTVWFDPGGGTKKKFGIKYPVVVGGDPDDEGSGGTRGSGGRGRARRGEGPPPDEITAPVDRMVIYGPGKDDARSLMRGYFSGVDVAIRAEQGTLQYELKVPLARSADHPYAIETAPGKKIGVGLETAKMQRSSGTPRGGGMGGMLGGGRGRGGGGTGGRSGGGGDRQREFEPFKPLKGWGTVTIGLVR